MDIIFNALKDQRRHKREDVLAKLKLKKKGSKPLTDRREDRLRWFIKHGTLPKSGSKYRWNTHESESKNKKWIAIEVSAIKSF